MKKLNWSAVSQRLVLFVAAGFIAAVCGPEIPVAAASSGAQSTYFEQERTPVPVPEPSGFALFGTGVLALAGVLRWRFNQTEARKPEAQKQSWLGQKAEEMRRGAAKPPQAVTNAKPQVERGPTVNVSAKGTAA